MVQYNVLAVFPEFPLAGHNSQIEFHLNYQESSFRSAMYIIYWD